MSRVGKKPIEIPKGVEVKIEGRRVTVKGPKGELSRGFHSDIKIETKEGKIFVLPLIEIHKEARVGAGRAKKIKAIWGLTRNLIFNMIEGVTSGFEKKLEIEGIGYKAELEGKNLILYAGFSHPIKVEAPEGIKFSVEKNIITVSGIDKELVGQLAAKIRRVRKPEPYKGKGIKYLGEVIRRKVGKKVAAVKE
jgi:large subunit ribosomal protein L6